jgi:hypothetical protein
MFLKACSCEIWKDEMRRRAGFTGHLTTVPTEREYMDRAMAIFCNFFNIYLKDGFYCNLITLYYSVVEGEHDQEINEYGRAVLKRLKFLLKHAHCKHYCHVFFPDQTEYILQRKTALAMGLHSRLGAQSFMRFLDPTLTEMVAVFSLNGDPFLDNKANYTSLHNRFAALHAADWGE